MKLYVTLFIVFAVGCSKNNDANLLNKDIDNCIKFVSTNKDSFNFYYNKLTSLDTSKDNTKGYQHLLNGLFQLSTQGAKSAIPHYLKAKDFFSKQQNSFLLNQTNLCLAYTYNKTNKFDSVIMCANEAAFYFDSIKNNLKTLTAYANLIQTYQVKSDFTNAYKYIDLTLKAAPQFSKYYLNAKHTMANIYGMKGLFDSAMSVDYQCLQIINKDPSIDFNTSAFFDNLAQCHLFTNRLDSSEYYFKKSIYADSISNNIDLLADTYSTLVGLAVRKKDDKMLQEMKAKALASAERTGNPKGKVLVYTELYNKAVNDRNLAAQLQYKDSMYSAKNEVINVEKEKRIAELNVLHQSKYKDLTIKNQQSTINKTSIINTILISIVALCLVAFYLWKKWNKQKRNQEIQAQKEKAMIDVFEAEQKERIRIATDLHDSIGQKLAVTKMYFENNNHTEKGITLLETAINEVRAISHNLIPDALNFGLISAFKQFHLQIKYVKNIKFNLDIASNVQLENNINRDIHIYRIYQELITNMIKYSNAKTIDTKINLSENVLQLVIVNDGVLFNTAAIHSHQGIGLKNIFSRLVFINGNIDFKRNGNKNITTIQLQKDV